MKNLLKLCLVALPLIFNNCINKAQENRVVDSLFVASWNIENLFDIMDDPKKNDSDFLPTSSKDWNEGKFAFKLHNLARVINYMNNGKGPDIIGLQEVENMGVLKHLVYRLHERDYVVIHRDSPDERGIDVAIIYDREVLDIVSVDTLLVKLPTNYNTRYILHAILNHRITSKDIHVFVNHWPSRRGGEQKSEPNREAAASTLKNTIDILFKKDNEVNIIILGDFNDEPSNISLKEVLGAQEFICENSEVKRNQLYNLAYLKHQEGKGTYLYGAKWNMLDQIIVSTPLIKSQNYFFKCDGFEIIKPEFMVQQDGERKGAPLPTYTGNKYLGGFSDHFPVSAKFYIH